MAQDDIISPYGQQEEERQIDQTIAQAVEAAAKGENVDQLLEAMLGILPSKAKEKIKQKFAAALKKRGLKQLSTDATDVTPRGAVQRLRDVLTLSARQAFERVTALVRARPDIAKSVEQAGKILAQNGVLADKVQVSEADLGTLAPLGGGQKDRTTGRSA